MMLQRSSATGSLAGILAENSDVPISDPSRSSSRSRSKSRSSSAKSSRQTSKDSSSSIVAASKSESGHRYAGMKRTPSASSASSRQLRLSEATEMMTRTTSNPSSSSASSAKTVAGLDSSHSHTLDGDPLSPISAVQNGDRLRPRSSTRPSFKRAASRDTGVIQSPSHLPEASPLSESIACSTTLATVVTPDMPFLKSYVPDRPHSSSMSLPLTSAKNLHLAQRCSSPPPSHRNVPSLQAEVFVSDDTDARYLSDTDTYPLSERIHIHSNGSEKGNILHSSPEGSEILASFEQSHPSFPSSFASQHGLPQYSSRAIQALSLPYHQVDRSSYPSSSSSHMQHPLPASSMSNGFIDHGSGTSSPLPSGNQSHTDPLHYMYPSSESAAADKLSKGKGRSRNASASSSAERNEYNDLSTDLDLDAGTDVASDATKELPWDVRETDKLRSAKDALGRKMINQYARVAEIGKGMHGRVWLCEDTDTKDFFAIKSVNREDRKQRSLRRSQAEAEALRRADSDRGVGNVYGTASISPHSEDDPQDMPDIYQQEGDFRKSNASLNNEMDFNDPRVDLLKPGASGKRSIVVDEKVRQEIAIMKRCHHPHVVQLREVIDDRRSKKIFMVLEYMPGGQVEWTKNDKPTMTVDEARSVFRNVVLGLEYLHYQGIIHRDIKPANLLWTQDHKTVKISDFGVSHVSDALARTSVGTPGGGRGAINDDRALRKTEGSPAFFAPELCAAVESTPVATPVNELERLSSRPEYFRRQSGKSNSGSESYRSVPPLMPPPMSNRPQSNQRDSTLSVMTISPPLSAQKQHSHRPRARERPIVGKGIDVWALGVTLYCFLFGCTPFHEATSEYELYNIIPRKEITIPPTMGSDNIQTGSGAFMATSDSIDDFIEGAEVVNLLSRLLEKDPTKRIELHEVKKHPWVLRNLGDSQGWLAEHDLADTRVVRVTEEEVQQATAERTTPQIPSGGLKASFKRFGEIFGLGGHSVLRRSTRRDRSKSVSSTSASISTSVWDGKSEPSRSRGASRQASIIKKRSSITYSSKLGPSGTEDLPVALEQSDTDANALLSHAMALKRKLTNAKAARDAHEAALSVSTSSAPPTDYFPSLQSPRQNPCLGRSVSGESIHSNPREGPYGGRRQSVGSHLQPPTHLVQRRVSTGAPEATSRSSSTNGSTSSAKVSRPSLSSVSSRPWSNSSLMPAPSQTGSDVEGKISGSLRSVWNKFRSGSRTPAATVSPRPQRSNSRIAHLLAAEDDNPRQKRSPRSTRRASAEYVVFSPNSSTSRPSSQDTESDLQPSLMPADLDAKILAAVATAGRSDNVGSRRLPDRNIYPEEVISDSSDSLSDDFDDEEDYGEALSPLDQDNTTQPSSFGTHQPLMWSDQARGWHASPKLATDPLGRVFFRHQYSRQQSESGSSIAAAASADTSDLGQDITPKAIARISLKDLSDDLPIDNEPKPHLSRDGSISKDISTILPPSSPGPISEVNNALGHMADDENDDEGEEEVMIKPRSRLRRSTNPGKDSKAMF